MGRTLETLRKAQTPPVPPADQPPAWLGLVPGPGSGDLGGEGMTIPFIEVGPRRSMEASPGLLTGPPPAPVEPAPAAPGPVAFRPLPGQDGRGRSRFGPELLAYHSPEHAVSAQYRELLARLLTALPGVRHQALLFTPASSEFEGTTVFLNVAITAAREGRRRVLAVDANLRQPEVARRLGLPEAPGLREVLAGLVSLDQAVRATEQPELLALAGGTAEPGPGMRFVAETMRSLLRQFRQRFDLVLVNGPRWDGLPDVTLLGTVCDAVYLVLPEREVETPEVDDLLQSIPRQGARLAGCVLAG